MPSIHRSPKKNGYTTNLKFDKTCTNKNNEKNETRKQKKTWFNPPFNINVAINVAKNLPYNNRKTLSQGQKIKQNLQ